VTHELVVTILAIYGVISKAAKKRIRARIGGEDGSIITRIVWGAVVIPDNCASEEDVIAIATIYGIIACTAPDLVISVLTPK